jgi:hypothetical protein
MPSPPSISLSACPSVHPITVVAISPSPPQAAASGGQRNKFHLPFTPKIGDQAHFTSAKIVPPTFFPPHLSNDTTITTAPLSVQALPFNFSIITRERSSIFSPASTIAHTTSTTFVAQSMPIHLAHPS